MSTPTNHGTTTLMWQLSRPDADTDRRRARLVSAAVTGVGVLLLAVLALLTVPGPTIVDFLPDGTPGYRLPAEARDLVWGDRTGNSLRHGTVGVALLLALPFVLFGVQALRTGTAARERRLAALSLAGATRPQLRRLAFLEGMRAAVSGGLLAGPGYLLVWLVLGRLLPEGSRLLPDPTPLLAAGWLLLAALLTLAGGAAAALVARPVTGSPLGVTRRRPRPLGRGRAALPGVCLALIVISLFLLRYNDYEGRPAGSALLGLVVVLALSSGPWLIELAGRAATRSTGRGGPATMMAGQRLLADVRSPGRVAAVLSAVGLTLGVIGSAFHDLVLDDADPGFALAVLLGIAVAGLLAAVIASLALVVGVTDQVLDGRRAMAALVALAASPGFVQQVVRRQLLLAAVPAATIGALAGWCADTAVSSGHGILPRFDLFLLSLPVSVLVAGLAATAGALVAARAVAPAVTAAATPDNLRTP